LASNRTLIVPAGVVISDMLLMKLHNFSELSGIIEPIKVQAASEDEESES
jgi:hypothetical protein